MSWLKTNELMRETHIVFELIKRYTVFVMDFWVNNIWENCFKKLQLYNCNYKNHFQFFHIMKTNSLKTNKYIWIFLRISTSKTFSNSEATAFGKERYRKENEAFGVTEVIAHKLSMTLARPRPGSWAEGFVLINGLLTSASRPSLWTIVYSYVFNGTIASSKEKRDLWFDHMQMHSSVLYCRSCRTGRRSVWLSPH